VADFIEVSSKKEAQRLAYQHYQDKGSLTGGTKYILPDGTKLRVRKRISNVSGASDLKVEGFETKTKADVGRSTRIGSSRKEINRAIRNEAAAQWDELVGDRNATINIGGKPYSFDKYLNKEVRDHSKLTRQKAVESVNLGKSLGHGTPTTDVGRYAESYTQQFAETPSGNYSTQDYIPPDQLKRLQKAGLATSPQEAARLHVGTTKIGGRLPDPEIEKTLKINLGDKPVQASRLMPKGVTRNPQVVPTRSQSLGQRAAAIANREPLPQPKPQPAAKPAASKPNVIPKPTAKPAVSTTSRRGSRAGRRGQGSTRGVSARSTIETRDSRPLSAFNRGSSAYGGIERQTNDFVQDLPGYSPFLLRLAD